MAGIPTSSPYDHGPNSVSRVMLTVIAALVPAVAVHLWLFGPGLAFNLLIACTTALLAEGLFLLARGRPVIATLRDGSALLTAVLLGIALPPLSPWWLVALGSGFAIVFGKQMFGGLGFNPFNPAMLGYVVLLTSFPLQMTTWMGPHELTTTHLTLAQSAAYVFGGHLPSGMGIDSISSATPLDSLKTQIGLHHTVAQATSGAIFGTFGGKGWEWVNGMFLLGGLFLLWRRVITWHTPVAMLSTLFLMALLFHLVNPERYVEPLFHLFSGGAMLGAFMIATDPVTAPASGRGRLIFGAGIGLLVYIIRTWGGYPDAVAFSVLLMNMAAPTIDYYVRTRVFGHQEG